MNKNLLVAVAVALLTTAGVFGWWYWRSSPERQIKKLLVAITELGSSPIGESTITKALRAQKLARYFSADSFVEWPGDEIIPAGRWSGRENIRQQVLAAKSSATYSVAVEDLAIVAQRRSPTAGADFSLVVKEGGRVWAWLATVRLMRISGDWSVNQVVLKPILRR